MSLSLSAQSASGSGSGVVVCLAGMVDDERARSLTSRRMAWRVMNRRKGQGSEVVDPGVFVGGIECWAGVGC
jgi:hypothetical protein